MNVSIEDEEMVSWTIEWLNEKWNERFLYSNTKW